MNFGIVERSGRDCGRSFLSRKECGQSFKGE
jgi:hypothetical protein